MKPKKTYCIGGRHYSETIDQTFMKNLTLKLKKLLKIIKGTGNICRRNNSQIFSI